MEKDSHLMTSCGDKTSWDTQGGPGCFQQEAMLICCAHL